MFVFQVLCHGSAFSSDSQEAMERVEGNILHDGRDWYQRGSWSWTWTWWWREESSWDCVVHDEWQIKITELKNYNLTFLLMILFILVGCTVFQSTPIRVEHISKNMRFLGVRADMSVLAPCLCLSFVCVCVNVMYIFTQIKMYWWL